MGAIKKTLSANSDKVSNFIQTCNTVDLTRKDQDLKFIYFSTVLISNNVFHNFPVIKRRFPA